MRARTLLEPIVAYLHGVRYDDLPSAVAARAVDVIVDTVGCAIGGILTEPGAVLARVLRGLAGQGCATGLGVRSGMDLVSAVLLNAYLADILDYEDTVPGLGHPSAVIVPAALAVGETVGATGRDVVVAVVVGYEVGVRVGRAVLPSPERRQQVPVQYSWNAFGAVAAASKLLGLSAEATLDAFGYAGAASPLPTWTTRWGRPAHWLKGNMGEQARAGILGAILAQEGFRGPRRILDSDLGFWRMIGSDRYDPTELTRGLGVCYEVANTHFKPYPACRWLHTTVAAVRSIVQREGLGAEDIEEIIVRSFRDSTDWFDEPEPATLVDAQFSIPYAVAVAFLDVPVGPAWYRPETLYDPQLLALARRVRVEGSEEADVGFRRGLYPSEVTIRTRKGLTFATKEDIAVGSPARPLTTADLKLKFANLTEVVLGSTLASKAWQTGRKLPSLGDVQQFTTKLIPSA